MSQSKIVLKSMVCIIEKAFYAFCLVVFCLFISSQTAIAQATKELASEVSFASANVPASLIDIPPYDKQTVENPSNALADDENFARLVASPGIVASLGSYEGEIELKFATERPANTWSYVRIGADQDLLGALLGGSLGELLADVLGTVILGRQGIEIQARNAVDGIVLSRTSTQGFDTDEVRLVQDGLGNYFLAIKPDQPYDRIRLINSSLSLVGLGTEYTLDVYHAFYLEGDDTCGDFRFTSFDGEGISLDLVDLGGAGVTNAGNAVDADPNSFSSISIGTLGVGASMFQEIHFEIPSAPEDYFKVKLDIQNPGVLTADLIGGIEVRAYDGDQLIYIDKLSSGLINGLDVLALLQGGNPVSLAFGPGRSFDKITVGYNSLVSLSALSNSPIRLYDVQRFGVLCTDPDPIPLPTATDPMLSMATCDATVLDFGNANFPFNAVDGNNDTFTTLEASSGTALGIGDYEGFIELGFPTRSAGTTSYIRIDFEEEVLLGLLDGSVGQLLGGVVDNVLFGSHYFTLDVKNNGGSILTSSSNNGFFNAPVRIVQDKNNHYYVAVTPDADYNSIRITESLGAILGLGETRSMNVYHVCTAAGFEACEQAFLTYSESNGISLDLLGLGEAGVTDAGFAIDGDAATASEISIGAAGLGASVYQFVEFHSPSAAEDHFRVKLAMSGGSAVTAEVLGSVVIKAFDGDTEVFSQDLRDGLISDLDLLGLLQSGAVVNLPFGPGLSFDRVAIGIESLVGANVIANPLLVYSIERFSDACPDPELVDPAETDPPFNVSDCAGEVVDWSHTNFPLNAIDGRNDTYATLSASAGTALGLGAYSSHIELKFAAPVPAGETSYVRIGLEEDNLNALLGGSLGDDLANLLGAVALGDQYFTVTPKNAGGTDIYTASSATGFGSQNVKVVQDAEGRFYIAFTADESYQSVRIDFFLTALVGVNNTATMKVYSLCRETEFDLCEQATFTSYDGAGIALDLIDITQGGVFNPQFAIDGNSSNYSTINLGVVGAAASVFQEIYFKTKSQATDALRLRIQLDQPGTLNLDLAGAYRLILYNGEDEVYNESLQNALVNNLDLLGLLNSGGIQELLIEPGVVYDRVAFGIQSLVAVNTSAPVRLYGISRISDACPDPDVEEPPYLEPVCAEELISAENADNLANLFDGNFNSYATIRSEGGTLGLGAYSGHVTLGFGDGVMVPAGTTSYMRIDMEDDLLNTLLGGSLGTALSDILGNVVLGDHYFDVIVNYGAGNPLFTASSADAFAGYNDQIKVVKDALGRSYLAITPSAAYNSVRIEDHTSALLLGQENSINIYGLCYETGTEDCATGFTTSFEGTGISVDAGAIGGYGVTNPERALDNNNNDDYSELSLGTLSVAGSIQQSIHFRQSVPANGTFKIKLGVGSGVLDASIFDRVSIVGYLDGNEVYDEALQDAVLGSVNLVNLFNNGSDAELRLSLGVEVDEVALKIESVVSATLVPNVRLFYIVQDCETPDFQTWKSYIIDGDASLSSVDGGETVQYTIHIRNTGTISMLDYQIQDEIPANTTYVPGSGGTLNGNTLVFEDLDIAPGQTLTQSFSVIVDENLTGITEITNLALVKANPADPGVETYPPLDNENPNDPDETGDTGTDIPVDQIFEIESWKAYTVDGDASLNAVSGGEALVYTIFVRNTGNQDLTDVVITDDIPSGTSYVSGGTMAGNSVTFTIPTLAVGETSVGYSFTVTVDQDLTELDEIRNVAVSTVTGGLTFESYPPVDNQNPLEPDTTQPPGTVVDVTPVHSVEFSKIGISNNATSTGQAEIGDEITYTLSITNTGNKELTGITIEDVIPAGLTVMDAGGASVNGSTLEFSLASLSVGQTLTVEFIVSVDNVTVGSPIVNEAEAFYPDETNNPTSVLAQHSMPTDCVAVDADDISLNSSVSEVCVGGEVTLTAALNGISIPDPVFKWYTNPALSGTPFEGDTYVVNPTATTTYYVIVEADGYCFNEPPAAIEIVVNPLPPTPTASADVTISEGFGTTLFATIDPADPSVEIVWFNDLDQQVGVGPSYDTGVLTVGTHFFYAAARNTVTGCVSAGRDEVIVTVVIDDAGDCTIANGQTVGTDGLLCLLCFAIDAQQAVDGNSATASRLTVPVGLLGSIYQTLSFPTQGAAGDSVRIDLGIPGGLADVNLLSRIGITVLNGNTVVDEFSLNESLVHLTLLGGSGMQRASFPVSGSFDRVRISLTGVANVLTSLDIYQAQLVFAAPTAVTTDAEVCQGETALLEVTPAAGTSLRWYDAAVGGTLLSEGNSYTTAALNSPGTVTYYLAVLRNGCESPDRIPVEVTVNPAATAADITATGGTICEGESFTLSASAAGITNPIFRFYTSQDLTTEITDLTVSPTATTTYYVTVEGDGVCENAPGTAAELTVTVNPAATASDITATGGAICEGESFTLSASAASITNPIFRFYTSQDLTTEITDLTVSPTSTTTYYVTVEGDGVCENAPGTAAELTVTVNPAATASDITATGGTICEGESFTLSASAASITNPIFRFYTDQTLATEITDLTVSPTSTTTYYVTVEGDGVCENAPGTAAELTVTVNPAATASDITATGGTICEGESFTLSASAASITNPIFRFYTSQDLTTEITDLTVSPTATTTYYVTVEGDGVCENAQGTAAELTVTVNPAATAADITTTGGTICEGEIFTLSATSATVSNPVFRFYTSQDLTTEITDLTVSPIATTTYYVTVEGDGICENAPGTAAELTVTVNPVATDADINISETVTQCEGEDVVLMPSSSVGNAVFTWYFDAAKTSAISTGTVSGVSYALTGDGSLTISGLAAGSTSTYYVTVTGDGVCENETGKAVSVTITNSLEAPEFVEDEIEVCGSGDDVTFEISNAVGGLAYMVYDAAVGGNEVTTGIQISGNQIILESVAADQEYYVGVMGGSGCESMTRTRIAVVLVPPATAADITATGGTICEGDSFTLSASAAGITNPIFRFYTDQTLATEITDLTVSPTATTTYYVTVEGEGVCENAPGTAAELTVTVNPLPDAPMVANTSVTITEGFATQLSASAPSGSTVVWYNESNSELTTGPTYTTPVLSVGTYTYYVSSRDDITGCESAVREMITVVVIPANPVDDCTIANGQTVGTDGLLCLLCFAIDAQQAVDGNSATASRLTVPVGLLGSIYQTLSFPTQGAAGDSVRIDLGIPGGLADVNLLSRIGITVLNGNTVVDEFSLNESLVHLTLLGGSGMQRASFPVSGSFDRVRISLTGVANVLTSLDIYQAQLVFAAPTAVTTDAEVCQGETALLEATPAAGTSLRWYDAAVGGTLLSEGNSYTTAALNSPGTVTYYLAVLRNGCESPDRIPVEVTVNPAATAADITATGGTICEGDSFTLSASAAGITNPVFRFYTSQDLTTEITDLTVSPTATTTYYVTVEGDGVCENAPGTAAELTVTVNPAATAADITATGGTICEGDSFTLSADAASITNPIFRFYTSQDLTTEITDLTVSPIATITYYVTVEGDGVCENAPGTAAELTVTVNPVATAADITATGGTICEGESFTLSASAAGITNPIFRFYTDQTLATEITDLTVSPTATTTYYVTVEGDGVCENAPGTAAELTVTVNPVATGADINISETVTQCEGEDVVLMPSSSVGNAVFTWYFDAAKTSAISTGTVSGVSYALTGDGSLMISGLAAGSTSSYYVTVTGDGVCENETGKAVSVTITNSLEAPEFVEDEIEVCGSGDDVTFEISNAVGGLTYMVYDAAVGGNEVTTGIQISGNQIILESVAADQEYYVGVMGGSGCKSMTRTRIAVVVVPPATAADITATGGTICEGESFTLSASAASITNPIFRFYTDQTLATEITDLTVSPTATTTYYVTVEGDGVCENAPGTAAELTVTVNPAATAADITAAGGTICEGESFTLSASAASITNPNFRFYTSQDLTTEITNLTVSPTATTTYYVTVEGEGVCENAPGAAAELTVTVNPAATAADITATGGTICVGESFTLSATSTTVVNPIFRFYTDQTLTTEITDLTVSPTATTTYYVTVEGDGVCENAPGTAAELTVTVNPAATAADITATGGMICEGESFTLSATAAGITNPVFRFYTSQDLTTEITDLNVSPTSTTTYYVTVEGDGVCENAPGTAAELTVTVNPAATAADITATGGMICEGESFTLSASAAGITNPIFRFYTSQDLTTEITDLTVSPTATTTYYVTVEGDGVCENVPGTAAELTVTVNPTATAADITATGGTICEGESFTLSVTSATVSNPVFRFYTSQDLTTEITDLTVSPTATTIYYVTVEGDGVCENAPGTAAELTVTLNPAATAADITATGSTICEGESFMLSATSATVSNPVFRFYADQTLATEITDLTVSPPATTTYYVTVEGDGVCENAPGTAAELTVTVNPAATASDITATGGTICEGESFTLSASAASITNPVFRFYADQTLATEITNLTVSPTATTTYYVTVEGDGVCENAPGTAAELTVDVGRDGLSSDIQVMNAVICEGESTLLTASSLTVTNPVFKFYTDEALTQEVTDLNVSPTVTTRYYVTVMGSGVCENVSQEAAHLTVTVRSTPAPQIDQPIQAFCADQGMPSIASLGANGTAIQWYESSEGGIALAPNTALTHGKTYYASQTDPATGCESLERTAVTVELIICRRTGMVEIVKQASSATVLAGGEIQYTISVVNGTQMDLPAMLVTDSLENTVSFVSASHGGSFEDGSVTWMLESLPARSRIDLQLTVRVNENTAVGTVISNIAVISNPEDPDEWKESNKEDVKVVQAISFTIDKNPNVSEARIGEQITYTITVANISDLIKENIEVRDTLPVGLDYISSDQGGAFANGVVSWIIPSLAPGQNIDMTLITSVTEEVTVGDVIYNTAIVDQPDDDEDPQESDPREGVEVIESITTMTVVKSQDVDKVKTGEMITYTIDLTNTGEYAARNVLVADTIPTGTMFMEASHSGEVTDNLATWMIEEIPAGESVQLTLTVLVTAEEGSVVNTVWVTGDNHPDTEDSTDPVEIDNINEVDLQIVKEVTAPLIMLGSEFEYKITVTNKGEEMANQVVVTDQLPEGLEFVSVDVNVGEAVFDSGLITWTMETLAPMSSEVMMIKVRATAEMQITNTATISSEDEELEPGDNSDSVSHEQLEFEIPNVFTPNGDGINDTWVLRGLQEFFTRSKVLIVNRWGVEVFRSDNYLNDWTGEELSGGTYYYQVTVWDSQNAEHSMTGFVTIIK